MVLMLTLVLRRICVLSWKGEGRGRGVGKERKERAALSPLIFLFPPPLFCSRSKFSARSKSEKCARPHENTYFAGYSKQKSVQRAMWEICASSSVLSLTCHFSRRKLYVKEQWTLKEAENLRSSYTRTRNLVLE